MELRHLRYFVAVAEELSFRQAAEKLHIAQPPLGRQIRDLEVEIGARLFERDRSGVALTDAGHLFLGEARKVLAAADDAVSAVRHAQRGARGELRIGNIGPLSATFLPRSLALFHKQFPQVEVTIVDLGHNEQLAELAAGNIHIGFMGRIGDASETDRFTFQRVLSSRVFVALSPRHALASQRTVPVENLRDETLINMRSRRGSGYEEWIRRYCQRAGFRARFRKPAVNEIESVVGLVAMDEGIALMPELATPYARGGDLVFRPLKPPAPLFELVAVWNPANPSRILSNYLAVLRKSASSAGKR